MTAERCSKTTDVMVLTAMAVCLGSSCLTPSGVVPKAPAEDAEPFMHRMPYHSFEVGQTVVAPFGGPHALVPRGPYVVVRLLPLVADQPQYRVRSTVDGHERVVTEQQIKPVDLGPNNGEANRPRPVPARR